MWIILLLLKVFLLTKETKENLNLIHKKFEKFKDKIIYLIYDEKPQKIERDIK